MLKAKIADNPYTQEKGLMFVEDMPSDEGMLFIFRRAQRLSFWGMNTFIPLDIAFIDENKKIVKIDHIVPHSPRPKYSDSPCTMALEVNRGYFTEHNIEVGDKCNFNDPPRQSHNVEREFGVTMISFDKEGQSSIPEKDIKSVLRNFKQSQSLPPVPEVGKPDQKTVGEPVTEQVGNNDLPVVEVGDLGKILEDSFDEQQGSPEQPQPDGGTPPEGESVQPDEVPQEETPQEPQKEYPVFGSAFQATQWGQQNNEVMRISYVTKHGRNLIRDVEPHGTFHSHSTHREILVVFDETVNDIRAFIVGNISKWAFVGKQFDKKFVVKS